MTNRTSGARPRSRLIRKLLLAPLGAAAIAGLVLAVGPPQLAGALQRFRPAAIPIVVALMLAAYAAQAWRWHYLLEDVGLRLRFRESQLLNMAGQAVTALIPIGDLTRAAFASQASRRTFGDAAATVTVQELSFSLIMVVVATPGIVALGAGITPALLVLSGILGVVALLTVGPVFRTVDALIGSIPLVNRLQHQIEELQLSTVRLLRKPRTLAGLLLDLLRAVLSVTAFWLIAEQLEPGRLSWTVAAFVLTFANVGGALSMIPGGIGAAEAGTVGLLVWSGMSPGAAGAMAILQRGFVTGLAVMFGLLAYAVARRRFGLSNLTGLVLGEHSPRPPDPCEGCLDAVA
ncbi:MAG: flippase-like domain-containing protein [Candidatus Dormibacteraeota bacterium]|nr:flippase-like domain-containing protein [Candidatus Dormibacteraeota bacterium]